MLQKVLNRTQFERLVRPKLNHLLFFFVVDEHKHVEAAQAADLDGLLEEATLSFAESNVAHILIFYKKKVVDFLLAHGALSVNFFILILFNYI